MKVNSVNIYVAGFSYYYSYMDFGPALLSVGRAVAFKANSLTERYLQEKGFTPLSTFALHRYALILGIIWALVFVRPEDIANIINKPHLVLYLLIIILIWNIQQFAHSYTINTTSTVSVLTNLHNILVFPLLLLIGTFFNRDIPNVFSVAAIVLLVIALLIKPAHHAGNQRARFSKPLSLIVGLIFIQALVDAMLIGLLRQLLKEIPTEVFIGVLHVLVIGSCVLFVTLFPRRQSENLNAVIRKHPVRSWSIPIIFFIGGVMEMYAQAALPIYIVMSIGALTFIMDVSSDLRQQRISFNLQTASFIFLILAGISLSVYSL